MKKTILLLAALAAMICTANAETEAANLHRQHYDFSDFNALSVSHSFRVELSFEDSYSVEVEVPDYIEPYLRVNCLGGRVRINLENLPRDVQRKLSDNPGKLRAWVKMPGLRFLSMSGATRVSTYGTPKLGDSDHVSLELSGASELESLEAACNGRLSIDISGASKATLKTDFSLQEIDLSGASRLRLEGNADKMVVDCSGASTFQGNGDYESLKAEVSGSSKMSVDGNVQVLEIETSGASRFDMEGVTGKAEVELSGVSKGFLTVKDRLQYELSGVSTLKIKDLGATVRGEISRGSKIEYIK